MKKLLLGLVVLSSSSCLDHSRNMVDGSIEPPHPNFWENTFSMKGVDRNKDGIRDDVERWINRKFPRDKNHNLRNLYKQEASALSIILRKNIKGAEELKESYLKKLVDSRKCASDIYDDAAAMIYFGQVTKEINNKIFNLPWRSFRKSENESMLDGKAFTIDREGPNFSRCDFEVKYEDQ